MKKYIKKILRTLWLSLALRGRNHHGKIDVIIGPQWGDEGKGKIVDLFASKYDFGVRFQGGNNAGHSLVVGGKTIVLHTVPSTIFQLPSIIGDGVVVNPVGLVKEIKEIIEFGGDPVKNLLIGSRANLILPTHILLDKAEEESKGVSKIGSTQKGIKPVYVDKTGRNGIMIGEIFHKNFKQKVSELIALHKKQFPVYNYSWNADKEKHLDEEMVIFYEAIEYLKKLKYISCPYFINEQLKQGRKFLVEGAQATMLDLSFGTYPYVTSSRTLTTAVPSELGVPAKSLGSVIGVFKAYLTKVGAGPFPTKIEGDIAKIIQDAGHEFGSTTGRPRDTGWLDLPLLKYAIMINGITELVITKLDILDFISSDILVCDRYNVNGVETDRVDFNLVSEIGNITPLYKRFPSWYGEKTEGVETFEDLPDNAQDYLEYLEETLGVPITIISVGPGKNDIIKWN